MRYSSLCRLTLLGMVTYAVLPSNAPHSGRFGLRLSFAALQESGPGTDRTSRDVRLESAMRAKADIDPVRGTPHETSSSGKAAPDDSP
jgi:hypothetical protein